MPRFRGLVYSGLMVSALFLLTAAPAAAFCSHPSTVYNTGTLTGTGNTCPDALASLEGNLQSTASFNCQDIYGPDADVDFGTYSESLNACVQNGVGKLQTGSASYKCIVCHCIGIHCG